jgi:hypothetical protein
VCEFAVGDDDPAVDEDVVDAGGIAVRVVVRRVVAHGARVENGDVGERSRDEAASVA